MTSKTSTTTCTADTEKKCLGMDYALNHRGARDLGITVALEMDMKTGACTPAFTYRTPKGGKLLTLNQCPWCGSSLRATGQKGT